jgi:hypothetical protein
MISPRRKPTSAPRRRQDLVCYHGVFAPKVKPEDRDWAAKIPDRLTAMSKMRGVSIEQWAVTIRTILHLQKLIHDQARAATRCCPS